MEEIHKAVLNNSIDSVHDLLKRGTDPNTRSKSGNLTPLMLAALKGHKDILVLLLQYGADPLLRDISDHTAYDFASKLKFYDIIEILNPHTK